MNLHAIAGPFVGIVNPPVPGIWWRNAGAVTAPSGKRAPSMTAVPDQSFQVQALSGPELALVEGLNIQGVKRSVHMSGLPNAVDRKANAGGDLLEFDGGDGTAKWLVVVILETWGLGVDAWSRVAVVKQMDAATPPPEEEP